MICVLWMALAAVGPEGAPPLIRNGGFEQGLEGWETRAGIAEDGAAHAGRRCATAEVTRPNEARFLRQEVELRAASLYRLTIWARGTNRTKLALWIRRGSRRVPIGQFPGLLRRWSRLEASLSVPEDGRWTIEIVAPSSHGAPPGRAWIDDVALAESRLPPAVRLGPKGDYATRPAVAVAPDGSLYVAWTAFRGGADRILWARIPPGRPRPEGPAAEVPLPAGARVQGLALAWTRSGPLLVASCGVEGRWDLYAAQLAANPPRLRPITRDAATAIEPAVAAADDRVLVAWESNRGGTRGVWAGWPHGTTLTGATCLSGSGGSAYRPAVALSGDGRAWVVWEAFRDGDYDLHGAVWNGRGWSPPLRLTQDPRVERRASLSLAEDGPWIAWEAIRLAPRYRTDAATSKEILVGRWGPEGLERAGAIALGPWNESPSILARLDGLWVSARRSRGQHASWDVVLWHIVGDRAEERRLTARTGRAERAPIVDIGGRIACAFQADNVPGSYASIEASRGAEGWIEVVAVDRGEIAGGGGPAAGPRPRLVRERPAGAGEESLPARRRRYGEDAPRRTITYRGETLQLYWGQFHTHTDISVCNRRGDLPPRDNYAHTRDIHRLDFSALTDHGYNISPPVWAELSELAGYEEDPGRFLTFLAEEWTSTRERYTAEHPYGYYGHRNLILADPGFPVWFNARDDAKPTAIWRALRARDADFVHIPHQLADTGNVPTDWNFADERAQPVAEIFQARGSYEYKGAPRQAGRTADGYFLQDAWAKGVVIGVIASPDHGGGLGKAAVYAPALTREAILDAVRARRTYGTTAAKIFLDVRVNGHLMGEKVPREPGPVTIDVAVEAPGPIARVDLCRSNRFIQARAIGARKARFRYEDRDPPAGTLYYYVRVREEDGELAWSSPVWLAAE